MDDLTVRLQALMRRYAADSEQRPGAEDQLEENLHQELTLLIATYGKPSIDAALEAMSDDAWPSVSLH
jgi:hypothetical protein